MVIKICKTSFQWKVQVQSTHSKSADLQKCWVLCSSGIPSQQGHEHRSYLCDECFGENVVAVLRRDGGHFQNRAVLKCLIVCFSVLVPKTITKPTEGKKWLMGYSQHRQNGDEWL